MKSIFLARLTWGWVFLAFLIGGCEYEKTTVTPRPDELVITPTQGQQGSTLNVAIFSANPVLTEDTVVNFGSGIKVLSQKLLSTRELSLRISIDYNAEPTGHFVNVKAPTVEFSLADGFLVTPFSDYGGLIWFSFRKPSLMGGAAISAAAVFSKPYPDFEQWFFGLSPAPLPGETTYDCLEILGEHCTVGSPLGPQYLSAGELVEFTHQAVTVDLVRQTDSMNPLALTYKPAAALDPAVFAFNAEYALSLSGSPDVPAIQGAFYTPSDFNLLSHDTTLDTLDVVLGQDLKLTWELPGEAAPPSGQVIVQLIRMESMLGPIEWLQATFPDAGEGTILASDIAQLSPGPLQTVVRRDVRTELHSATAPTILVASDVRQMGFGNLYPEGTKLAYLEPSRAKQGETLTTTLSLVNINLDDGTKVNFGAGVRVNSFTKIDAATAEVNLTIDSITPPGYRNLTVLPSGSPEVQFENKFFVDRQIPTCTIQEIKDQAISGTLVSNEIACGAIDEQIDSDAYAFSANAGEVVTLSLTARAFGSRLSSRLRLLDNTATEVARFDSNDGFIAYQVPTTGSFQVLIENRSTSGGPEYFYFLSLRAFSPTELPAMPANDTCDTLSGVSLNGGFYIGDTTTATNTVFSEFSDPNFSGCLNENQLGGNDAVYQLTLLPGETLIATLVTPGLDATVYLLETCGVLGSCLVASKSATISRPEYLTFRNDGLTSTSYNLVVDSVVTTINSLPGGKFYLEITVY